jgi:hypothetical protein
MVQECTTVLDCTSAGARQEIVHDAPPQVRFFTKFETVKKRKENNNMLYNYSFANRKRDLADVMSTVIKDEPRFISNFRVTSPASSARHEYLEDQLTGRGVTASAAENGKITFPQIFFDIWIIRDIRASDDHAPVHGVCPSASPVPSGWFSAGCWPASPFCSPLPD